MKINCYKGFEKTGDPVFSSDIIRYSLSDNRIAVSLKGAYQSLPIKKDDIVNIDIINEEIETLTFLCRFLSLNYVVYDDPSGENKTVVGDNTLLFDNLG